MPSPKALKELNTALRAVAHKMPPGSSLDFQIYDDHLWLERLLVPKHARGQGSEILAKILAAADQAGLKTSLLADPTDRAGDPTSFELARWYGRFGFTLLAITEQGVAMERQPRARAVAPQQLVQAAKAAKAHDLTLEEFERLVEQAQVHLENPERMSSPTFG